MLTAERADDVQNYLQTSVIRNIAILAAVYFIAGWVGNSLAIPPGYATIIWPASGIALCALLLFGERILPGVWLGSFAFNIATNLNQQISLAENWKVFAIAAAVGIGGSAQAFVGLKMARRFAGGVELINVQRTASGVLLIVLMPCLIAPSIGVVSLLLAGAIGPAEVSENWLTWFVGDVLGIILVLPILLLSNKSPTPVRWQGRTLRGANSLVAVCLATTLLLTFYGWQFILEREHRAAEENLSEVAVSTIDVLETRIQNYQRALEGAAALAEVSGPISPSEWQRYVDGLDIEQAYPGMRGFGMFEQVADSDLGEFQNQLQKDYGERFSIHPRVARDRHFVINRIEPLEENLAALGLDLAFEKGRRQAIALSLTIDNPILTRPIVLVQDTKQGAGFLLLHPVFDENQRQADRWVYAPLVAEELFTGLVPHQGTDLGLEVWFGGRAKPETLLYASELAVDPKFTLQKTVALAGRTISLRWTSLPAFERRSSSTAPLIVLVSGLLTTVLLGLLLVTFLRREGHIIRKVEQATADLAEGNRMLKLAEATAHIGHWHLELPTNRVRWSDEVYRLHGLEIGNTPDLERAIEFYHPDDRKIVENSLENAITTREPYAFKARLLSIDGQVRHVVVRGRVELGEDEQPCAILGVIMDRTEETLMRERLTETIEEARMANKAKSSFLANMSHEIRTPMNGVIGFTELAIAEETVPVQKRRLQMIADSGNAMLRLLNDLLDFAKIEAKQMAIIEEATDIRHTLRSCQRLMEPVAQSQNLALILDIDPAVPANLSLDKMRLRQIVLNLVGNALKFTENGEVRISAMVSNRRSDAEDMLFINVRDTGIGIHKDRLAGIFEKFMQADDTTARRYGGTGLGLAISADLAKLMGGSLNVESELGQGSSFTLALPARECTALANEPSTDPNAYGGRDVNTRLKMLIAEDNPVNQELTVSMVEKLGHKCTLVHDGKQAVDVVLTANSDGRPFDLVLMDMQMPHMDGLSATRAIRKAGIEAASLPILAVTANAYADDIKRCIDAGMQAHLAKPLRLSALRAAISTWTSNQNEAHGAGKMTAESPASQPPEYEEETDPRIRAMFEERKVAALNAIDAVLLEKSVGDNERATIAGLLHQISGVAAYFGEEELGKYCRSEQAHLLAAHEEDRSRHLLESIRKRLADTLKLA